MTECGWQHSAARVPEDLCSEESKDVALKALKDVLSSSKHQIGCYMENAHSSNLGLRKCLALFALNHFLELDSDKITSQLTLV